MPVARCLDSYLVSLCFFFFQAEDGIRDLIVTGVQTCALPIWAREAGAHRGWPERGARGVIATGPARPARTVGGRSEVRVASLQDALPHAFRWKKIGRASCRERV